MNDEIHLTASAKVTHIILAAVQIAGTLSIAAIAPNALRLIKYLPTKRSRTCYYKVYVDRTTSRLIKRGLLEIDGSRGHRAVRLTEKGRCELAKSQSRVRKGESKKWDGKWRVLIFDISENKRSARNSLRKELAMTGFVRLQNSVWINPYECEDFTFLLKNNLELGKNLLYMTVESLENDEWLRKIFELTF